tara:strand:+ start:2521 stop:3711 length:1191 start_codon:yes stop_codon:yes gene_type:complete
VKLIQDICFQNKTALVRVDFNVPISKNGIINDVTRIQSHINTINSIIEDGGKVILISHLGRPKGVWKKNLSLRNLVETLSLESKRKVCFLAQKVGSKKLIENISRVSRDQIILLENIRFYKEEASGDLNFCKKLSKLADVFVNDAFATAHRKHSSTFYVAKYFNEKCLGGLFYEEYNSILRVVNNFSPPLTAIIGGAKISSKINVIKSFMNFADNILIGGGMMFTFIKSAGGEIGDSIFEEDELEKAASLLKVAKKNNVNLLIPKDSAISEGFKDTKNYIITESNMISSGSLGMDIGPKTINEYKEIIAKSKTVVWNGPMGVFEFKNFSTGTRKIAEAVASVTKRGAFSLVGGGDSISALKKFGLSCEISYISTGGGAMLHFLEKKKLPAVQAILD